MSIEFHIPAFNEDKVGCKAVIALCPIESYLIRTMVGSGNKDYALSEPNLLMIYPEPPYIFNSRGWKRTEVCRILKSLCDL